MPKKTKEEIKDNWIEEVTDASFNSTPLPEGVTIKFDTGIAPLDLHVDLGREDLNQTIIRIHEKINELIKKG